jgi:hypothetical protein
MIRLSWAKRKLEAAVFLLMFGTIVLFGGCTSTGHPNGSTTAARSRWGTIVINPQFDEATEFAEGLAAIRVGDEKTGKWATSTNRGTFR